MDDFEDNSGDDDNGGYSEEELERFPNALNSFCGFLDSLGIDFRHAMVLAYQHCNDEDNMTKIKAMEKFMEKINETRFAILMGVVGVIEYGLVMQSGGPLPGIMYYDDLPRSERRETLVKAIRGLDLHTYHELSKRWKDWSYVDGITELRPFITIDTLFLIADLLDGGEFAAYYDSCETKVSVKAGKMVQ